MTYRKTKIEISKAHLTHNYHVLSQHLNPKTKVMAVLKANAYGHGILGVARHLNELGVDYFAVALLEEALDLREAGFQQKILVLGFVAAEHAHLAASKQISLTVFHADWIEEAKKTLKNMTLCVHLKIDSGMGRIGVDDKNELNKINAAFDERVQLEAVYTHFATADQLDSTYYKEQQANFSRALSMITHPYFIHTGNSGASLQFPSEMKDYVRLGIALYGLMPSKEVNEAASIQLKPVLSLKSELIHVKKIQAGDSISYGQTYLAKEAEWIGTIPLGYGDGYARDMSGFYCLIKGKPAEIVGRVCMDMFMVRLAEPVDRGTEVVLIGRSENKVIRADDLADHLGTINYEVTTRLNKRIRREYV